MQLTEEQMTVVTHPLQHHAKVLAVAGAGKTSTLAYRVQYLVQVEGVNPKQILVLMFNRLAREQFETKLEEIGLASSGVTVSTFHSFGYRMMTPEVDWTNWFGEYQELAQINLLKARNAACHLLGVPKEEIDIDMAATAIGMWKCNLTPPHEAGFTGNHGNVYCQIYEIFEKARNQANALTYDDFIPMAIDTLTYDPERRPTLQALIVDEYQDVNYGQQRMLQLLAGDHTDVMVVGDDDQTIYEWRGARSDYILGKFDEMFDTKPCITYRMTHSFRFGYTIAQSSFNTIRHNDKRLEKEVISHSPTLSDDITLITDKEEQGGSANDQIAREIITMVMERGIEPANIRVLGRSYSQLNGLQTSFLLKRIPFKVLGRDPYLLTGECKVLLNYLHCAKHLHKPLNNVMIKNFLHIANKPSRFLSRSQLDKKLKQHKTKKNDLPTALTDMAKGYRGTTRDEVDILKLILNELQAQIENDEEIGALLTWLEDNINLEGHYKDYYGEGENSSLRTESIKSFLKYANETKMTFDQFQHHIENLDSTQGRPESSWIKMQTVHTSKGLEFDYVIIPDCIEGFLPIKGNNQEPTYNKEGDEGPPEPSAWIENERRLFYVAVTRGRKEVMIGAPDLLFKKSKDQEADTPSRFLEEMQLYPVRQIAHALQEDNAEELVRSCNELKDQHHIVGVLQQQYSQILPVDLIANLTALELIQPAAIFKYKGTYKEPEKSKPQGAANPWTWIKN